MSAVGFRNSIRRMTWDEIYVDRGVVQREPMTIVKRFVEHLRRTRPEDYLHLLDAGCGTGRHGIYAVTELPRSSVHCFDSSPEAIRIFRMGLPREFAFRVSFDTLDMDANFDRVPAPFDGIVSTLTIHHGLWAQVRNRFRLLSQALQPNGLLAFACLSDEDPRVTTGYEVEPRTRLATAQDDGDVPHHFMSEEDLDSLFVDYGPFEILNKELVCRPGATFSGVAHHWEVLAQKVLR